MVGESFQDSRKDVSVVMSVYNDDDTISRAIESILDQSLSDFEFIIVDDGSTDDTGERIADFSDPRIKLFENDSNKGLPYSLNRGIDLAQGKYIARMDGDDVSRKDRLDQQRKILLDNQDIQVVGCWHELIGENNTYLGTIRSSNDRKYNVDELLRQRQGAASAHGSVMIRRNALDAVNGYREQFTYSQDLDLWLRMADEFEEGFMHIIPEVLYERYVTRDDGQKIPKQELFAAIAERSARGRFNNCDGLGVSERFLSRVMNDDSHLWNTSEAAAWYYHQAGHLHWSDRRHARALLNFVKCIGHRPAWILHLMRSII